MTEDSGQAQEQTWLARAAAGDPAALAALYAAHAPAGLRLAQRICEDPHLAEDALQTAFMDVAAGRVRVRPGVPVRAWLLGVIAHKAQMLRRTERARRRREGAPLPAAVPIPTDVSPEESDALVWRLVRDLPERVRTPLLLHVLDAQSFGDIARSLGRKEATVRAQVWRATQDLRRRLAPTQGGALAVTALWRLLRAPTVPSAPPWSAPLAAAVRHHPIQHGLSWRMAIAGGAAVAGLVGVLPLVRHPSSSPVESAPRLPSADASAPAATGAPAAPEAWIEPFPSQTLAEYAAYVAQLHQARLCLHPAVLTDLRLLGDAIPQGLTRPAAPQDASLLPLVAQAAGDVVRWDAGVVTIAPSDASLAQAAPAPARATIDRLALLALGLSQTPPVEAWSGYVGDTVPVWITRLGTLAPLRGWTFAVDPALETPLRPHNAVPGDIRPLPATLWTTHPPPPQLPRATVLRLLTLVALEVHAVIAVSEDTLTLIPAAAAPPGSVVLRRTW